MDQLTRSVRLVSVATILALCAAAARQSKFKPAMKDGKPVAYWVLLDINFNIR